MMTNVQAFDHSKKVVYDVRIEDGMLKRIHSWDYVTLKNIFDEYRNPGNYIGKVKPIQREHFIKAVEVLCNDFEFDKFKEFLQALKEDKEYLSIARETMGTQLIRMTNQANRIGQALWYKE